MKTAVLVPPCGSMPTDVSCSPSQGHPRQSQWHRGHPGQTLSQNRRGFYGEGLKVLGTGGGPTSPPPTPAGTDQSLPRPGLAPSATASKVIQRQFRQGCFWKNRDSARPTQQIGAKDSLLCSEKNQSRKIGTTPALAKAVAGGRQARKSDSHELQGKPEWAGAGRGLPASSPSQSVTSGSPRISMLTPGITWSY